ncbi:4Fe-4S binding protein [Calditerrivibrio nitroreducens]|uniref:4Fe-4S binding protein n=1 Tax=Calditerrivibrio nitroreducens TaxID=477976 RepID=UPI003C75DC2F
MMRIKTGFEILNDLLGRGYFSVIYVEQNFPLPFKNKAVSKQIDVKTSVELLLSAAVVGNNVVGIYHSSISPRSNVELKGGAVFISTILPIDPMVPVVFCRSISNIFERFNTALKVSEEFKIPVMLCINENAIHNFYEVESVDLSSERVSATITSDTFKKINTNHTLAQYNKIFEYLEKRFVDIFEGDGLISFGDSDGKFLKFYVPFVMDSLIEGKTIQIDSRDLHFWESITKLREIALDFYDVSTENQRIVKNYFCPGCPFLLIKKNVGFENKILVTDINCPTIRRVFGFKNSTLDNVIGFTLNKPSSNILFVGNLSNLKSSMIDYLKNFEYFFLNDGLKNSFGLPSISKPYKFKEKNAVFPYSCENIQKSSVLKVNPKKCVCIRKNEKLHCVEGSYCPALFENNGTISVNENLCVGCKLCELYCPYGAIK